MSIHEPGGRTHNDTAASSSEEKTTNDRNQGGNRILWELVKIIGIAFLIVLPVRLFIMQPFFVRGASMEPTYHDGDYLIIDELSYRFHDPHRGDVIVFRYPLDPSQFFIKRIVGLPGETVMLTTEGELRVISDEFPNGAVFNQAVGHLNGPTTSQTTALGDDEYYVLGDNREASSDSRRWGPLAEDFIVGRAWLRLWPFDDIEYLAE